MKTQVAQTILEQLGGNKFIVMVGAHSLTSDKNALIFKLRAQNEKHIKAVKVVLNGKDLYDIEFYSIQGYEFKTVGIANDVYNENLQDVFTSYTGLATKL